MRAPHEFNSASFRTSLKVHFLSVIFFLASIWAACRSSWTCSLKAPWRAKTPTVTSTACSLEPITRMLLVEILILEINNTCDYFSAGDVVPETPASHQNNSKGSSGLGKSLPNLLMIHHLNIFHRLSDRLCSHSSLLERASHYRTN